MSSRSTASFSLGQMYCCLRRVPHFLCRRLKLTAAELSLEEKRLTGTETSPNEIVAEPMGRAGIGQTAYEVCPGGARRNLRSGRVTHSATTGTTAGPRVVVPGSLF